MGVSAVLGQLGTGIKGSWGFVKAHPLTTPFLAYQAYKLVPALLSDKKSATSLTWTTVVEHDAEHEQIKSFSLDNANSLIVHQTGMPFFAQTIFWTVVLSYIEPTVVQHLSSNFASTVLFGYGALRIKDAAEYKKAKLNRQELAVVLAAIGLRFGVPRLAEYSLGNKIFNHRFLTWLR